MKMNNLICTVYPESNRHFGLWQHWTGLQSPSWYHNISTLILAVYPAMVANGLYLCYFSVCNLLKYMLQFKIQPLVRCVLWLVFLAKKYKLIKLCHVFEKILMSERQGGQRCIGLKIFLCLWWGQNVSPSPVADNLVIKILKLILLHLRSFGNIFLEFHRICCIILLRKAWLLHIFF